MSYGPIGLNKWELDTPALCLDIEALQRNVNRMASYFADKPTRLRPHCKTHKCPTIAWMQLNAGAIGITCAKLGEAEVMAEAGIRDLLIANQIVGATKIRRLINLAAYTDVMVAVDDLANAQMLSEAAEAKGVRLRVLIEVDNGMGRCGVPPGQATLSLAQKLLALPGLLFEGVMGYEGHAVMIPDFEERKRVVREAMGRLVDTAKLLELNGIEVNIVSGGGTGTYNISGAIEGMTEIQAGSYATMDGRYKEVGLDFELALSVVARVISAPTPDRAVVDAGLKTLSPEFGLPKLLRPAGWVLAHLSEEHGTLRREGGAPLKAGDTVEITPAHGCTTINLHDNFYVTRQDIVEAVWPIAARGCVR